MYNNRPLAHPLLSLVVIKPMKPKNKAIPKILSDKKICLKMLEVRELVRFFFVLFLITTDPMRFSILSKLHIGPVMV